MPIDNNKKITYTKADIKLLRELFINNSGSLYQLFYNNSQGKSTYNDLYKNITTELNKETPDSQQLTTLIQEFVNSSSVKNTLSGHDERIDHYSGGNLKTLLSVIDKFTTKAFDYNGKDVTKFARQLVNQNPDLKKITAKLDGYKIIANKLIENRDFSKDELKILENSGISNYKEMKKDEALKGLNDTYNEFRQNPIVLSAARTNYLKNSGFHTKDNLVRLAIGTGIGVLGVAAFWANIPFGATDPNVVSQALFAVIGGAGGGLLAATMGVTSGVALANRGIFLRNDGVRNSISQIQNKKAFFEKVQNLYQQKGNKVSTKDILNLEKEIQKLKGGESFTFGNFLTRKRHFQYIAEATKLDSSDDILFGYNALNRFNKHRLDKKIANLSAKNKDTSVNLSPVLNTITDLLKDNKKLSNLFNLGNAPVITYANKKVIKPSVIEKTPVIETQPSNEHKNINVTHIEKNKVINSMIDNSGSDSQITTSLTYNIGLGKGRCNIVINKGDFLINKTQAEMLYNEITKKLATMQIGKDTKKTKIYLDDQKTMGLDVALTPEKKPLIKNPFKKK